jgi:pantothenate kinase
VGARVGAARRTPASHPERLGNVDFDHLGRRARLLVQDLPEPGCSRCLVGITGPPGAGKSTVAERLAEELAPLARLVPMDGFHLASRELARLGLAGRKGAPDTFDSAGFVHLLKRLARPEGETVYAPEFDRAIDEPIAGSIAVPAEAPLVIVEGNYLLLPDAPWNQLRGVFTEVWYCDTPTAERRRRLIQRHEHYGRTTEEARAWVDATDEPNARRVAATRGSATLTFTAAVRVRPGSQPDPSIAVLSEQKGGGLARVHHRQG